MRPQTRVETHGRSAVHFVHAFILLVNSGSLIKYKDHYSYHANLYHAMVLNTWAMPILLYICIYVANSKYCLQSWCNQSYNTSKPGEKQKQKNSGNCSCLVSPNPIFTRYSLESQIHFTVFRPYKIYLLILIIL